MDDRTADFQYDLYGVIVHEGESPHSGHYYAYVKHKTEWLHLDDKNVRTATSEEVLNQQAYVLFYSKKRSAELPQGHSSCALGNGDENRKAAGEDLYNTGVWCRASHLSAVDGPALPLRVCVAVLSLSLSLLCVCVCVCLPDAHQGKTKGDDESQPTRFLLWIIS